MNRRDFTKLVASTALATLSLDKASALNAGKPRDSNSASNNPSRNDAYVRRRGTTWILGTSLAERRIALQNGQLQLISFMNKRTGREYRDSGSNPSEIRMKVDGSAVTAPAWAWALTGEHTHRLSQGELQLDLQLKGGPLQVTRHWLVYPGTAIVREWLTIENVSSKDVRLQDVFFLNTRLLGKSQDQLALNYLTGGANFNGSQLLKAEEVTSSYQRTFDSHVGVKTWDNSAYSEYLPLVLLRDSHSADTLALGWDYLGHWLLHIGGSNGERIGIGLKLEGYDAQLKPGSTVETPKAFAAAISGSLDEIGNQILDWQYAYLWDYTNPEYFGKTRWAINLSLPWRGNGGIPSADNWGQLLAEGFRYVDLLRESGGDILWDDAGWYDCWGSWNGPDWSLTTDYLKKHDMRWLLWFPTFLATPESAIGQKHPEWLKPGGWWWFDQSIPATRTWQKQLLDAKVTDWGNFQWRYDIAPAASSNDTTALAADQNLRELIREFKTSHPESGVGACYNGGRWISYDLARFAESGECTDGGVGPYTGYYTSLLIPPDKLHNGEYLTNRIYYEKACDRSQLVVNPAWYRDPGNGPDVESIRKDWELYHYLISKGVAGRGSHVFRPRVLHDDPIWYSQRMDKDGSSGIIIAKHIKTGAEYFLISKPLSNFSHDHYEGGPVDMPQTIGTNVVKPDTGIYSDPIDSDYRYYGSPGESYGPLSFRYKTAQGDEPYVRHIVRHGAVRTMDTPFFGMAFQTGDQPLTISELGQFDPGGNRGKYLLELLRAEDRKVLGSVTLDMSLGNVDPLGFKYAKLSTPIRLEPAPGKSVVIFPGGLRPDLTYDVETGQSGIHLRQSGAEIAKTGISLPGILPGELIFLNLPNRPGSKTDTTAPTAPSNVTKRIGTNLGVQGVEVAWSPGHDNNWISYYEVLKNGSVIGKTAKGAFFFDHSTGSRRSIGASYQVRTVDGDGNRSPLAAARTITGEPETHQPLGEFGPTQGGEGWRYEQTFDEHRYHDLVWNNGGYEGFWAGSGLGRIGRIWSQPSASANISRTFLVPAECSLHLSGQVQMDPSATNEAPVYFRIEHNGKQIHPRSSWAVVPQFDSPVSYRIENVLARQGDAIRFVLKRNDDNVAQPVLWNPIVVMHNP